MTYTYNRDDIQEILQTAIALKARNGDFAGRQLPEIAAELGISPGELQQAEEQWLSQRNSSQMQMALTGNRFNRLKNHIFGYLITSIVLGFIDFKNSGHLSWSLYVIFGWGFAVALDAWRTYTRHDSQGSVRNRQHRGQ